MGHGLLFVSVPRYFVSGLILPQTLVSQNTANIALGNTEESHRNNLDVDLAPAVK